MIWLKNLICPNCGSVVKNNTKAKFQTCTSCKKEFNVVTKSIKIQLGNFNQQEAKNLYDEFYQTGELFIRLFNNRFSYERRKNNWHVIDKAKRSEEMKCSCGEAAIIQTKESLFCYKCGISPICGKTAKDAIYQKIKEKSSIERKTYVSMAFDLASDAFEKHLKNNWVQLLSEKEAIVAQFEKCRKKKTNADEYFPEAEKIREFWRKFPAPISILKFYHMYYNNLFKDKESGRILKKNLKKRRERIKKQGKVTNIGFMVAEPVCAKCENLKQNQHGYYCKLDYEYRNIKMTKLPKFPKTVIPVAKESYKLDLEKGCGEVALGKLGVKEQFTIMGLEYLKNTGVDLSDNSRYPDLLHPVEKGQKNDKYYLVYPATEVVPLKENLWQHLIVFGPNQTCILSLDITHNQQKVQFLRHGEIVACRDFYENQRQKANPGYKKKVRNKGSKKIKNFLHNETAELVKKIKDMPGEVIVFNIQKKIFGKETEGRKDLNKDKNKWSDSEFRQLIGYKAKQEGFRVKEIELDATQIMQCPYCNCEQEGSWQDNVVTKNKKSMICQCGKETNIFLAIALNYKNQNS